MSIPQPDIKLLWGRAGGRCAFCKVKLTPDKDKVDGEYVLGEQAHIVGEKSDAPRGKSVLTPEQRNSYANLILLCPTHHTEIDKDELSWPVDLLHQKKTEHERWVEDRLAMPDRFRQAEDEVYAYIVQQAATHCMFDRWNNWTEMLLSVRPAIREEDFNSLGAFVTAYIKAPLSGKRPELERALKTLYVTVEHFRRHFEQNAEPDHGMLRGVPFYKLIPNNPRYDADLAEYNEWEEEVFRLVVQCTKAANWVAEAVRDTLNPMFYAIEGKFTITEGPSARFDFFMYAPEYSVKEKSNLPSSALESLQGFESSLDV